MDYRKSLLELKKELRRNSKLNKDEWDNYARENGYFSSITIYSHMNVNNWAELVKKIQSNSKEVELSKEIEKVRKTLHKSIEKNGLNSEKTKEISKKIDTLINSYYENGGKIEKNRRFFTEGNSMEIAYKDSIEKLKEITTVFGEFPTIGGWNKFAKEQYLLSSESLKYISGSSWNQLRDRVISDTKK